MIELAVSQVEPLVGTLPAVPDAGRQSSVAVPLALGAEGACGAGARGVAPGAV